MICKINHFNGVFFAISGFGGFTDSNFNPKIAAINACKTGGTIPSISNTFQMLVKNYLRQRIEEIRQADPIEYKKDYVAKDALSVIFFGFENNTPALALIIFQAINSVSEPVQIRVTERSCPGTAPASATLTVFMGDSDEIKQFRSDEYWSVGAINAIRKLIELQASIKPATVGGPIDIVRLSEKGAE